MNIVGTVNNTEHKVTMNENIADLNLSIFDLLSDRRSDAIIIVCKKTTGPTNGSTGGRWYPLATTTNPKPR